MHYIMFKYRDVRKSQMDMFKIPFEQNNKERMENRKVNISRLHNDLHDYFSAP